MWQAAIGVQRVRALPPALEHSSGACSLDVKHRLQAYYRQQGAAGDQLPCTTGLYAAEGATTFDTMPHIDGGSFQIWTCCMLWWHSLNGIHQSLSRNPCS